MMFNSSACVCVSLSDPVPVFMSWQEETESGEAQLSPLAGRMVLLPLEDDTQPLLARRFLDFGHSQRFLQQDQDATSSSKALSCGRWAERPQILMNTQIHWQPNSRLCHVCQASPCFALFQRQSEERQRLPPAHQETPEPQEEDQAVWGTVWKREKLQG